MMDTLTISSSLHSCLCPDLRQRQNNVIKYVTVWNSKSTKGKWTTKVDVTATAVLGRKEIAPVNTNLLLHR